MWDEAHEEHLSFIDTDTASRVVISTRVKGILKGASAVQLQTPSDEDAAKILMTAAEMPAGMAPPSVAYQVIEMCNRLPLALVMAGKLIAQLGLGENWDGVTDILDEELRENEQTSSEQRIIKASLAGLKGSARDKNGINNLFAIFALVPEDTVCPIETLVCPPGIISQGTGSYRTPRLV